MANSHKIQMTEPSKIGLLESAACTIFLVPRHVKEGREHLFHPRTVSIGPYHHGGTDFADMEKVKDQFLDQLLPSDKRLGCISELKKLENEARRCYFHNVKIEGEAFVQMLLKDGCFIIQFLLQLKEHKSTSNGVCRRRWIKDMIIHDLLLVENQIPFFVLKTLYDHLAKIKLINPLPGLHDLINNLLPVTTKTMMRTSAKDGDDYVHLIHLCHHNICSHMIEQDKSKISLKDLLRYLNILKLISKIFSLILFEVHKLLDRSHRGQPRSIPSLTRLRQAGAAFQSKASGGLFDISFTWDGLLEIPTITLCHEMSCLLANFVAFEQCTGSEQQPVSSYAIVMNHLVDTPEDAELLVRAGILERMLPSNEDVALLFNQLSNSCCLDYDNHEFKSMFEAIENYNRILWHAWRGNLVHGYFSNPWSVISLLAAIFLMVLTLVQTILAILSFVNYKYEEHRKA